MLISATTAAGVDIDSVLQQICKELEQKVLCKPTFGTFSPAAIQSNATILLNAAQSVELLSPPRRIGYSVFRVRHLRLVAESNVRKHFLQASIRFIPRGLLYNRRTAWPAKGV